MNHSFQWKSEFNSPKILVNNTPIMLPESFFNDSFKRSPFAWLSFVGSCVPFPRLQRDVKICAGIWIWSWDPAETLPEHFCNAAPNWAWRDELIQALNENISLQIYIIPLECFRPTSLLFAPILKHYQEVEWGAGLGEGFLCDCGWVFRFLWWIIVSAALRTCECLALDCVQNRDSL